jgi:hypothetical protein
VSINEYPGGRWRKSRRSNGQAECVEVGATRPGVIAVRDSKDPDGPRLAFGRDQWRMFGAQVKASARKD